MSLPKSLRLLPIGAIVTLGLMLGGCTLTPVYGDSAAQSQLALRFAETDTRLEQVFYRALSLRVPTGSLNTPEISATVSASSSEIGLSSVASPVEDYQVIARVTYQVSQDGDILANGTRTATAGYQTTGQIVADDRARDAAIERAVEAVAQTVRLELIGQFAAP